MLTPDQLQVDDIVEFPPPLDVAYPGPWLVVSVGVEWVDFINREGMEAHAPSQKADQSKQPLHLNKLRRASKLDKLILFYDRFIKGLKK